MQCIGFLGMKSINLENNPADIELSLDCKKYYFDNTLGTDWRKLSKDELDDHMDQYIKLAEQYKLPLFVPKIHELVKEGKVDSLDKILIFVNLELPYGSQREGHGTDAMRKVEELYGPKGQGYEYIICDAVTDSGRAFAKKMGFEQLVTTLYGKSLVE
ncbi:hypothetical protein ISS04_02830 [Candidatus Woesearchaeota archaeon]|nr:hypothetical protein [Candidatus Woesearchaeota archaeon]